jgi:hypothetical protein
MKRLNLAVLLLLVCTVGSQSLINLPPLRPFESGQLPTADDFNYNFETLYQGLQDLSNIVSELKDRADTNEADAFPIGSITPSVIDPNTFQQEYGDYWILADGSHTFIQNGQPELLTRSKFGQLLCEEVVTPENCTVPDLRGVFLRGANSGRGDGLQDPDGERLAGSFQDDSFEAHTHELTKTVLCHVDSCGVGVESLSRGSWAGSANVALTTTGGNETRPKNIAVYYYIKIN